MEAAIAPGPTIYAMLTIPDALPRCRVHRAGLASRFRRQAGADNRWAGSLRQTADPPAGISRIDQRRDRVAAERSRTLAATVQVAIVLPLVLSPAAISRVVVLRAVISTSFSIFNRAVVRVAPRRCQHAEVLQAAATACRAARPEIFYEITPPHSLRYPDWVTAAPADPRRSPLLATSLETGHRSALTQAATCAQTEVKVGSRVLDDPAVTVIDLAGPIGQVKVIDPADLAKPIDLEDRAIGQTVPVSLAIGPTIVPIVFRTRIVGGIGGAIIATMFGSIGTAIGKILTAGTTATGGIATTFVGPITTTSITGPGPHGLQ